jgi:hypothetical protein
MRAMVKTSFVACLSLFVLLGACKKDAPASPTAPVSPTAARRAPIPPLPAPPARVVGPAPAELTALLTEDKLAHFAAYQKEMLAATADATGLGLAAYQKSGTDSKKFQNAVAADDRAAKVAAVSQAALEKCGLTQDEVSKLNHAVTPYYARLYAMQDALKKAGEVHARIEEAKAKGKEPSPVDTAMDKVYGEQSNRIETMRKDFAAKYGEDGLAVVKKHEPEFMVINEKMMAAAMGGMMRKP